MMMMMMIQDINVMLFSILTITECIHIQSWKTMSIMMMVVMVQDDDDNDDDDST